MSGRLRGRRARAFAPPFVVTIAAAACSSSAPSGSGGPRGHDASRGTDAQPPPPRELSWIENRGGVCTQQVDCSPVESGGVMINPCNPPPPTPVVECPPELLATQPPGTTVERQDDGTCWVTCDATTCDAPGPLRVRCPADGAPPPTYATALVVPPATKLRADTAMVYRNDDLTCYLQECAEGTKCAEPPGRRFDNVPCPPELVPRVADGVVAVSTTMGCFYGKVAVACPDKRKVWR